MRGFLQSGGVALGGLITSLLTVAIVVAVDEATGFGIFTFAVFLVVPVGAALCGAVAASGYYLASIYLHRRPRPVLLVQMAAIAALTQFLIYYAEYLTLVVDGTPVSAVLGFGEYMDIVLTKAHYGVGRTGQIDTGEVGSLGYALAALQFIGFLAGGVGLYLYLKKRPFCEHCSKYFQLLKSKQDLFGDQQEFVDYYDAEFADPVDSPEFAARVAEERKAPIQQGTIKLVTRVLQCPGCAEQIVHQAAEAYEGRDWKPMDELNRTVPMPKGIDVSAVYGGREPGLMARFA